jgi:hypothetical protein
MDTSDGVTLSTERTVRESVPRIFGEVSTEAVRSS